MPPLDKYEFASLGLGFLTLLVAFFASPLSKRARWILGVIAFALVCYGTIGPQTSSPEVKNKTREFFESFRDTAKKNSRRPAGRSHPNAARSFANPGANATINSVAHAQ
jgi:hypothetical protein